MQNLWNFPSALLKDFRLYVLFFETLKKNSKDQRKKKFEKFDKMENKK